MRPIRRVRLVENVGGAGRYAELIFIKRSGLTTGRRPRRLAEIGSIGKLYSDELKRIPTKWLGGNLPISHNGEYGTFSAASPASHTSPAIPYKIRFNKVKKSYGLLVWPPGQD